MCEGSRSGQKVLSLWKGYLGTILFLAYAGLLFVACVPEPLRPPLLNEWHKEANGLFTRYNMRAEAAVFRGNGADYKRRTHSVFIIGETVSGEFVELYRSYKELHPPSLRLLNDDFDTMVKRMSGTHFTHRLKNPYRRTDVLKELRDSSRLRRVSAHFAKEAKAEGHDLKYVYTVWFYESTSYSTGEIFPWVNIVFWHYLKSGQGRNLGDWPELKMDPVLGITLSRS